MNIEQLWRDRVEEILGICAAGGDSHREVAVMSEYVEADYHGRFLVELLQNANDQAIKAGHLDSTVRILRTESLFAATNEGAPFDDSGLKSVTSLGLSPKDPTQLIGNKGIGFKSVYQISRRPEIYSTARPDESFRSADSNRFRMLLNPFETSAGEELLLSTCRAVLQESPTQAQKLQKRAKLDPLEHLLNEVKRAAPFKFPLTIPNTEAERRFAELGDLPDAQTLVVLPLIESDKIGNIVSRAIEEVLSGYGAAIMFLHGIGRLGILDRVNATETLVERQKLESVEGEAGITFERIVMRVSVNGDLITEREWRVAGSVLGSQGDVDSQRLQDAASKLPGSNWDAVNRSPVAVAIPLLSAKPVDEAVDDAFSDGKLCIGLPTKDKTGTPAWAHAHFFGTISRKGIDLTECDFNRVLFEEILRVHHLLLKALKTDPDIRARRAVTLAYMRSEGPLADALHGEISLPDEAIILDESGSHYIKPEEVSVIDPTDYRIARRILDAAGDLRTKVRLPESWIAENATELLRTLTVEHDKSWTQSFVSRDPDQCSILEAAARHFRNNGAGVAEWEPFLDWVLRSFAIRSLLDQRILPTSGGKLAASADTVFLPPASKAGASKTETSEGDDEEDAQIDLGAIPENVLSLLNFLDPSVVKIRAEGGWKLTGLGSLLAPEIGDALVRRPRLEEVLNGPVSTAMKVLAASEEDLKKGIALLGLSANWLSRMSETAKAKVVKSRILVPVVKRDGTEEIGWVWQSGTKAYFGAGWLDQKHEALLLEAYGSRDETLLVNWSEFSSAAPADSGDCTAWVDALQMIGVSRWPKLIDRSARWKRSPFQAYHYEYLNLVDAECPIAAAAKWWKPYLESCRLRRARTKSGYYFDFASVTWIDGLESEQSRPAVFRLMLLRHDVFERHLTTSLERQGSSDKDGVEVASFWTYTIRHNSWQIVPTSHDLKAPFESWLLEAGQSTQTLKRLETLFTVEPEYRRASQLLRAVGVSPLAEPPIDRVIGELNRIARRCDKSEENRTQATLAMVQDLFERLQKAFREDVEDALPELSDVWLPLECEGKPMGLPAKDIKIAYVDDAPERAKFISGFSTALLWPLQTRFPYKRLVESFREQLGAGSVTFTRDAAVSTGFVRNAADRILLLEWIRTEFPGRDVATDLGCLIAYSGRETSPTGEQFGAIWRGLEVCQIAFGRFPEGAPEAFFLDSTQQRERELQVDDGLPKTDLLAATWVLVAPSYRDAWRAYVEYLSRNNADTFFRERRIFAAHREEVESAIGMSTGSRLHRFRPALFALWRKSAKSGVSLDGFENEWDQNVRSSQALCRWLGGQLTPALVSDLAYLDELEGSLKILGSGDVSIPEWQSARQELGLPAFRFPESENLWNQTKEQVVALLKATAARSPLAELDEIKTVLETAVSEPVPAHHAETRPQLSCLLMDIIKVCESAIANLEHRQFREVLQRRLAQIAEFNATSPREVKLEDPPERDLQEYRDFDEVQRGQRARDRLNAMVEVSQAVATQLGEMLDTDVIKSESRIQSMSTGYWANRFCLLPAYQAALLKVASGTHQRLTQAGVFRSPLPLNEMFELLPGVPRPGQESETKPVRRMRILGKEIAESEVEGDLAQGALGALGQKIRECAENESFPLNVVGLLRDGVTLQPKTRKGHGGGSRRSTHESERDKALYGRIGEIFVYELLKARAVSGFDETAWRSENRVEYLGEGQGNDSLGYDFSFNDESGALTGRAGAVCLLEVKSSSGDADGPFQMSENEWTRAIEANQNADEEYLIVRVARVSDSPTLVDIIADPYRLRRENKLHLLAADLWVYPGQLDTI
jgi:hypothetical protein